MTLRSIDTQLSVSRSLEASSIQNQLTHKPSDDQLTAAAQAAKHHETQRLRSNQVDKSAEGKIRDGSSQNQAYQGKKAKQESSSSEEEQQKEKHPYKGKFIDLSL